MNLYGFVVPGADGTSVDLWDRHGEVVLVVALPSRPEPSPRAEGLQRLADTFRAQGFTVLGVPLAGGPRDGAGYGVTFPVLAPQDPDSPLLSWLVAGAPMDSGVGVLPAFTRFLVGRDGTVVARFPADGDAKDLIAAVQAQLARPVPPTPERPAPPVPTDPQPDQVLTPAGLPAVLEPAPVGADGREILEAELVVEEDDEVDTPVAATRDGEPVDERLARLEQQVAAERLEADLAEPAPPESTGRDLQDLSDDLRDLEIDAQLRQE